MHTGAEFSLPLDWADFDEIPILFANHFLVQFQADEFVLSLNQVTGPPLVGTAEEMRDQLQEHGSLPIHTLARVGLTRRRLTELVSVLQAKLDDHDRALGGQPV
jgi:hypothetical protein